MALTQIPPVMIDGGLGLDWQSSVETSSFTAVNGNGYFVNTTSGSITVTMPSSPTTGDSIGIIDYAGTAASNTIILTSSNNIQGSSNDKIVNYTRGALRITYADVTQGWVASAAANEGTSALNPSPFLVDFLVVAGGGGGAGAASNNTNAGGAGAGGLKTTTTYGGGESVFLASLATTYTVEVGPGGAGASGYDLNGVSGTVSKFGIVGSETAAAGGGGSGTYRGVPQSGGSGGGAGSYSNSTYQTPGAASPAGQGNAGGAGMVYNAGALTSGGGGGGAGAGAAGVAGSGGNAGTGGSGLEVNIIGGTGNFYAGGGGGGGESSGASGGSSIGGTGASTNGNGSNGTINTGSGGGGATSIFGGPFTGGTGGGGIVILRYPSGNSIIVGSGLSTGVLNGTVSGGTDKYTTFTGGTGTITFS
jgi:hypothetical protein